MGDGTRKSYKRPRRRTPRLQQKKRLERLFRTPEGDDMDWDETEETCGPDLDTDLSDHELD